MAFKIKGINTAEQSGYLANRTLAAYWRRTVTILLGEVRTV